MRACVPWHTSFRRALACITLSVGTFTAACSVTPQPVLIREPRPEPLPLRVGVHYSHDLRTFSYQQQEPSRVLMTSFALGEPSVRLLHEALALLFLEVVELSATTPSDLRDDLAGVIEPRIAAASYSLTIPGGSTPCVGERCTITAASIGYGFTLRSRHGVPLASWVVSGTGGYTGAGLTLGATVGRSFEQAMRDAAWNLTSGFRDVPEIRRWLNDQGLR